MKDIDTVTQCVRHLAKLQHQVRTLTKTLADHDARLARLERAGRNGGS